ncbi:hypothetical protein FRB98_000782, partial [Tulasnella sp. 332]
GVYVTVTTLLFNFEDIHPTSPVSISSQQYVIRAPTSLSRPLEVAHTIAPPVPNTIASESSGSHR